MTPQEFFFHLMAGREGSIDMAVKTTSDNLNNSSRRWGTSCFFLTVLCGTRAEIQHPVHISRGRRQDGQRVHPAAEDRHVRDIRRVRAAGRIGVDDSSPALQARLNEESTRLVQDRRVLRTFVFPRAVDLHHRPDRVALPRSPLVWRCDPGFSKMRPIYTFTAQPRKFIGLTILISDNPGPDS